MLILVTRQHYHLTISRKKIGKEIELFKINDYIQITPSSSWNYHQKLLQEVSAIGPNAPEVLHSLRFVRSNQQWSLTSDHPFSFTLCSLRSINSTKLNKLDWMSACTFKAKWTIDPTFISSLPLQITETAKLSSREICSTTTPIRTDYQLWPLTLHKQILTEFCG